MNDTPIPKSCFCLEFLLIHMEVALLATTCVFLATRFCLSLRSVDLIILLVEGDANRPKI